MIPPEYDGGFFARIGDILVNDRGIWVSDVGHSHVLWFDESGNLMAEFGREGSGPGEFLTPSILAVDSLLTIDDPRQGRQVRFLLDGSQVETTRVVNLATQERWRVILPARFLLRAVYGGLLYGVARDELDVPSVGTLVNPVGSNPVSEQR